MKPKNALEELIISIYGDPPPPKRADEKEAAELAEALLLGKVPTHQVNAMTKELNASAIPYSTYDLALSVSLHFFKDPNLREELDKASLMARAVALQWNSDGLIAPLLLKSFEETLYRQNKREEPSGNLVHANLDEEGMTLVEEVKRHLYCLTEAVIWTKTDIIELHERIEADTANLGSVFKNIFKTIPYDRYTEEADLLFHEAYKIYLHREHTRLRELSYDFSFNEDNDLENPNPKDPLIYEYADALFDLRHAVFAEAGRLLERQKLFYDPESSSPAVKSPSLEQIAKLDAEYKDAASERKLEEVKLSKLYVRLFPDTPFPRAKRFFDGLDVSNAYAYQKAKGPILPRKRKSVPAEREGGNLEKNVPAEREEEDLENLNEHGDEVWYEIVAKELESNEIRQGLMLKAETQVSGDKEKARLLYVRWRVEQLKGL